MGKPHADDIHRAMDIAGKLAAEESDNGHLARCFLYFHERNLHLESVYEHVENYLHSGMAEREHARLLQVLEQAREAGYRQEHEDRDETLGL